MKGLSAYSGLTAKIRAMQGRLFSEQDFREFVSLKSVPEAVRYLQAQPAYAPIFSDLEYEDLHRGQIEHYLSQAIFIDFQKIYHFANQKQRGMLLLLFERYIPVFIKRCLYRINDKSSSDTQSLSLHPFFVKNAKLDAAAMLASGSMEELINALSGSGYDRVLRAVYDSPDPTLLDYELAVDMYYYTQLWKKKDQYLKDKDLEIIRHTVGMTMDLLNLQWIYRCKRYYKLSPAQTSAMLIPVHYKLHTEQLHRLIELSTIEELQAAIDETVYGKAYENRFQEKLSHEDLEQAQKKLQKSIYFSDKRKFPYSIAIINSYIYEKETEVSRIITALECIRYSINPGDALQYIEA